MGYHGDPMETVPGELIRCTLNGAKQAIAEYIRTMRRPTCVTWSRGG